MDFIHCTSLDQLGMGYNVPFANMLKPFKNKEIYYYIIIIKNHNLIKCLRQKNFGIYFYSEYFI